MSSKYVLDRQTKVTSTFEAFLDSPLGRGGLSRKSVNDRAVEAARKAAVEEGRAEGYEAGFDAGLFEGAKIGEESVRKELAAKLNAEIDAELNAFRNDLQNKVDALNRAIPALFSDFEDEIADRVIEVVRRLTETELATSRESTLAIIRSVIGEITAANHARIRINPIDSQALSRRKLEIMRLAPSLRDIEFVEDPEIAGGCVIETSNGTLDASIDTRLNAVEEAYREAA